MIPIPWPPGAIARLRELRAEGHTAKRIAVILSEEFERPFTRNAIVGMAYRQQAVLARPASPARARTTLPPPPPAPGNFTILDLTNHTCRHPIGDRAPFLYCGLPPDDGNAYCPDHHRKNYVRVRP